VVTIRVLDKESLYNIVAGATFLGAGGGGSPADGLKLVDKILNMAGGVELVSLGEAPDTAYVAMIAGIGAPRAMKERGFDVEAVYAYEALERIYNLVGIRLPYLMAGELGGFNTITPMYVAAYKKLPLVDCDGNGRAVPELATCLYPLYEIPASPLVLADRNGNVVIGYPKDPMDTAACENIARSFAVASGMVAAFGTWVVNVRTIKQRLVPNSVSKCENIGKAIKEAVEQGKDPVTEAANIADGYELIRGIISDVSTKTVEGFDFGRTTIEGTESQAGKKLYIDFKNENMIAWDENNEPVIMVPDLICLMTKEGETLTNADTQKGMDIAVIGVPAPERWRAHPKGFDIWKNILEKIGYTGAYKPA